ncbi:MAG: hypothetical protein HN406_08575 [Lentisphaerae bacterium]|jgi:hypothetical protein|nr:hypothetical protein [Lentisphaerota bacterium]
MMISTTKPTDSPSSLLCTKTEAIGALGLTAIGLAKLGLEPVRTARNPYCRRKHVYLYDHAQILALKDSPAVVALRPKKRRPRDYASLFLKRFGTPQAALPHACKAMFSLNRYCKHRSCQSSNRDEIYDLKNSLVKLLYTSGFATDVTRHVQHYPEQECWGCEGSGHHWRGGECWRCDGSGIWREAGSHTFICFRFHIDGERFTWHQPDHLVDFPFDVTGEPSGMPSIDIKPLEIPSHKLTEARKLVRWVLSGWDSEVETTEQDEET